jgi:osmotically-inducible protein OsmY
LILGWGTDKLGEGGWMMTKRRGLRTIRFIVFAVVGLASISMVAEGCNTVQPPNRQASDVQITTQVKAKLVSDVRASSLTNVDVNTTNGVVTLAGQVENEEVKHSAETVSASVPGVVKVNNNLQVAPANASVAH